MRSNTTVHEGYICFGGVWIQLDDHFKGGSLWYCWILLHYNERYNPMCVSDGRLNSRNTLN